MQVCKYASMQVCKCGQICRFFGIELRKMYVIARNVSNFKNRKRAKSVHPTPQWRRQYSLYIIARVRSLFAVNGTIKKKFLHHFCEDLKALACDALFQSFLTLSRPCAGFPTPALNCFQSVLNEVYFPTVWCYGCRVM